VGAAPTTPGHASTVRWCGSGKQDKKVEREVNQWLKPRKLLAGSNLVDRGRFAAHTLILGVTPTPGSWLRSGGRIEGLRRRCGDAVGVKLAAYLVERSDGERGNPPGVARLVGGQDPLPVDGVGWGRSLRSSPGLGKPGTWRREAANPPIGTRMPRDAGEYRRTAVSGRVVGIGLVSATGRAVRRGVGDGFVESRMR